PQMARDQMQRFFMDWAVFDHIDRFRRFQTFLDPLSERTLAGADRAHEIEHLAAFLAFQRGSVEVMHDLLDDVFDAEEIVLEELVAFRRFAAPDLHLPGSLGFVCLVDAALHHDAVEMGVCQLEDTWVIAQHLEVIEKCAPPVLLLTVGMISADQIGNLVLPFSHMKASTRYRAGIPLPGIRLLIVASQSPALHCTIKPS